MKKIILASASPRRSMLLTQAGFEFKVISADCDETIDENTAPDEAVKMLSERKGNAVYKTLSDKEKNDAVIIAADTVVCLDGKVFGKPRSEEDALQMLMKLSGRCHSVYTGVYIIYDEKNSFCFCEKTDVFMRSFDKSEALEYIRTGEPMDKAGAYGIQEKGAVLVSGINGDFYNVVGLPICRLTEYLRNFKNNTTIN